MDESITPITDAAKELTEWAKGCEEWVPIVIESRNAMIKAFIDLGEVIKHG